MTNASAKNTFQALSVVAVAFALFVGAFATTAHAQEYNGGYDVFSPGEVGGGYDVPDYTNTYVPDYTNTYAPDYTNTYAPDYTNTYTPDYTNSSYPSS
ncbi:MAG TPA: hypothetical protein VN495_03010, partial [Candidatus Paceibacterota bacterium]|nr:hypothetical protein [Candidatus Paceibacterota bacterium]